MQKEQREPTGDPPKNSPESITDLSRLEQEVARQVDRYIELGFHKEVYPEVNEVDAQARYRADFTLPEETTPPESYKGRFDVPLLVEPRIPLSVQHRRSKTPIGERVKTENIQNLTESPSSPYLVWTHDGKRYSKFSVEQAMNSFADDEVGSPQIELTALYLQHPDYFKGEGYKGAAVIATGSRDGRTWGPERKLVWATLIDAYKGQPTVGSCWLGPMVIDAGKASRGKEITKLGKFT